MAGKSGHFEASIKALKKDPDVTKASVISDIGDFAHVITICGHDFTLKLQIPRQGTMDDVPLISFQSPHLSSTQCSDLSETLRESVTANKDSPDLPSLIFSLAKDGVTNFPQSTDISTSRSVRKVNVEGDDEKPRKKGGKKRQKGGTSTQNDDTERGKSKKKVSMKTAEDVVKRILWDESIPTDDMTIGYIDRFRGLQEKAFSAFSWEDIASVDYFTFAIPKHRIQYFKYKRLVVWDKTRRLDNVFGSTGSGRTIQEEIADYQEEDHVNDPIPASEVAPPTAVANVERKEPIACSDLEFHENIDAYGSSSPDSQGDDDDDDSDDEDGVVVTVQQRKPELYSDTEDEGSDDEGGRPGGNMAGAFAKTDFWQDKTRPNFFLCVRVTSPDVRSVAGHVQDMVVEREPRYESCCVPESMLHVTLCTMRLSDAEEAAQCLQVMRNNADELRTSLPKSPLRISGLDRFFHRVLYARVHHGDDFVPFVEHLCSVLRTEGIRLMDHHDFIPHMTVMKVSRPVSRAMGTKFISPHVYHDAADIEFGEQVIDSVYLCSMEKTRGPDGFYLSPGCITFMREVL